MWSKSKDLHNVVENTIGNQQCNDLENLEKVLKDHRSDFSALLKQPAKNLDDRNLLLKSVKEPVLFPGRKTTASLEQSFVDEALIISDMFNLNENISVGLLHTAEQQMHYYPDLTRGLVSVLLYYDARQAIVSSLKILIQARKGVSWAVDTSDKAVNLITKYTDKLVEKGLVDQIIALLGQLIPEKEMNLLHENRALGGPKHRRQVQDFFTQIRQSLADIVFYLAAQNGLTKEDTLLLVNYLASIEQIDNVNVTLFMGLLYAVDISAVVRTEESEDVVRLLPITSESGFVASLQKRLTEPLQWKNAGLQASVQLAWAVTLATFRSLSSGLCAPIQSQVDEDEAILDIALDGKALNFLSHLLQTKNHIYKEEFYLRRLHALVTDLIVQMPLKIKDLRNKADEVARNIFVYQQEGLEPPPNLPLHFQWLLNFIAVLYGEDPLELELCLEFWSSDMANAGVNYRVSQRQMALYKFIRLAGDLLPPSLYISYASMLCGLANGKRAAHQAFTLLKQNSSGGQSNLISWEHFFSSLHRYFNSLRQESLPVPDTIYRHKPLTKGITPQEVQGLQVVLKLMRIILHHDPIARISLAENPTWIPLVVMIGLLGCAVPLSLKGEIMEVLAAFAQSHDIVYTLWSSIETAQILSTTSVVSANVKGIQTELEDVESRAEEYPLTRAFLKLLDVMTDVSIPSNLGTGHRTPGFDPYLFYVKDSVFLRFTGRAYRNETEKWQIGNACIKLFLKLLSNYEPSVEDFQDSYVELPSGGNAIRSKQPGYHLLVHCLHDSNFLRLLLHVVDEGCRVLDLYTPTLGIEELETLTLNVLLLLKRVLQLQEEFVELIRRLGSGLRVVTLDSLLLGINSRTGKPDHMVNIGKLVTLNQHLPQHALVALHIIRRVAANPSTQNQLLALYTKSTALTTAIRHGFVEALEMEDPNDSPTVPVDQDGETSYAGQGCRLVVLHLLSEGINLPHPSLAHFLLGFNVQAPLSKTVLQQPGIHDQPRTCLHALLGILEKNILPIGHCSGANLRATELAYKLLYQLCSHPNVSDIMLRFLRSSNFLGRQVAALPFAPGSFEWSQLSQMSWLLKSVAVEVKIASDKGLQSHVSRLASLFLYEVDETAESVTVGDITDRSLLSGISFLANQDQLVMRSRPKIAVLLDAVNLEACELTPPTMEFFDPGAIEALVKQCEIVSEEDVQLTKISLLQNRLRSELANLTNVALGQRQLIVQEVQNILSFVVQRNNIRLELSARRSYLEGWRQVLECLLATGSLNDLSYAQQWNILTQITQDIFTKCLTTDNSLPDLVHYLSGVMVILLAGLRACALEGVNETGSSSNATQVPSDYVRCLDGTILRTQSARSMATQRGGPTSSATINVIQRQLVDWILRASGSAHRVRTNLYSALLNSLRISNHTAEFYKLAPASLLQTLVRDCSSGHDVQRMLALSLLDQLAAADNQGPIATFLSSQGYLKHMVNSLLQLDVGLVGALEMQPSMDGLRTLYVYESQMGLLTRLASSQKGALVLLESGIFQRLSEMSVFSQRPEVTSGTIENAPFIPDTAHRFHQILFPALQLSNTMLTALGSRHRTGSSEVIHFLLSHSDTVSAILRNRNLAPVSSKLEETALLTAVISRAAGWNAVYEESPAAMEVRGQLSRLEQVTLNLLPVYILGENILAEFGLVSSKVCLQVAVNILKLARSLTTQNRAIFAPSFDRPNKSCLSLGILTKTLISSSAILISAQEKSEICRRRLDSIQDLTTQQLMELLPVDTDEKLPAQVRRMIGAKTLEQELKNWEELLELCSLVLESATWLLWHHMEHYFQYKKSLAFGGSSAILSQEDLGRLKKEAPTHLNAILFKKMNECEQVYLHRKGRHGFVQALLRRVKRLLSV
ncbi:hypothetical protein OUZ56_000486 [Daphnia magna]|uniref:Nuclear pore complex protein Nup205 n=1 Tax=Daphnia magna TaxID=35525 RepID=A0ABQ9ZZZ3_9CRUS|nr:hypothetical protein OUZ56_000486 [Daphnia magna]